jgi:SSS family transporter
LLTAYQLLQQRFGLRTRRFASALFLAARNLGDGLRLYLTAVALKAAVGLSIEACIGIVGVLTIIYTLFGGMRSVVWNDCVQFVVYILAALATLWVLCDRLPGGAEQIWTYASSHDKLRMFDFAWRPEDPYTFWAGVIGGACLSLGTHGTDQLIVQRCLAARNRRDAGKAMIVSGLVVFVQFALFLAIGVGLACFFDAFTSEVEITKGDEAYVAFIVRQLPVGLVGLTLAGVFAAAMSTLSSSLNSSAAALVGDFGSLLSARPPSAARALFLSRLFTVFFGVIQMGIAIGAQRFSSSVVNDALAIAGFTAGILFGVFCLGLLPLRVTPTGALTGMVCGLGVLLCVKFGPEITWLKELKMFQTKYAWPWYPVIGSITTVVVGTVFSVFFPAEGVRRHAAK